MSNTSVEIFKPNVTRVVMQKFGTAIACLMACLVAVFFTYLLVCVVCAIWLTYSVPVSQSDLASSSWFDHRLGVQFHGYMLTGFVAIGTILNLVKQRIVGALIGALLAVCLFGSSSDSLALRLGVYQGDAKIGCYVYGTKECHEMLQLPTEGLQSIYAKSGDNAAEGKHFADWYAPIRLELTAHRPSIPSGFPGAGLLMAPMMLLKPDELERTFERQRADLAAYKQGAAIQ